MIHETCIPQGIVINNRFLAFIDIHNQFAETPYGQTLEHNIRFAPYKPSETPNREWERLLGLDVNNLNHLRLSIRLSKNFLSLCSEPEFPNFQSPLPAGTFNTQEQALLLLTATVHDWGESIIGDIPFFDKTQSGHDKEMHILRSLMGEVIQTEDDLSDQVIQILSDHSSKLGHAFHMIECMGYIRTGLLAWKRSQIVNGSIRPSLVRMSKTVVPHHLPGIQEHREVYPPIKVFIDHHQPAISAIMSHST